MTHFLLTVLLLITLALPPAAPRAGLVCRTTVRQRSTVCECRGTRPGYRIWRTYPRVACRLWAVR